MYVCLAGCGVVWHGMGDGQGGYTMADRNVRRFWRVMDSFTPADQAAFLRFVTRCVDIRLKKPRGPKPSYPPPPPDLPRSSLVGSVMPETHPRCPPRWCVVCLAFSCPRPPPLGFAGLQPTFTIHRVGISRDDEKLPSASSKCPTCLPHAPHPEPARWAGSDMMSHHL